MPRPRTHAARRQLIDRKPGPEIAAGPEAVARLKRNRRRGRAQLGSSRTRVGVVVPEADRGGRRAQDTRVTRDGHA